MPPRHIRLIGGQWKRTRLAVADKPGLRPTPDRVRETLFNWLGQDLTNWRVLDAFAGTGALGLEAASRQAQHVLLVEQDAQLAATLRQNSQRLSASAVRVLHGDGVAALCSQPADSLDLIFLDPPFAADGLYAPALDAAIQALRPDGFIYLEASACWQNRPETAPLALHRHLRAGAVHAHLYCKLPHPKENP